MHNIQMEVLNIWLKICLYLLFTCLTICWSCPHSELLKPCKCTQMDTSLAIICGGNKDIDLSSMFLRLSNNIAKHMRHFAIFYLNNTAIKTLPAFVFHNITFKHIYFDGAIQLEYIHPNAFMGTQLHVEYVNAWNTHLESYRVPNENDAFSRLINLKYLDIANQMYCPNEDLIKPCYCKIQKFAIGSHLISMRSSYTIHCDLNQPYYIKQIFQRITTKEPHCNRHFDNLYLDNHLWTNYTEIPEDAFSGVTFSNIYLQACDECNKYKLTIHPRAFGKTRLFVQSLKLSTNIASKSDLYRDTFVAVNSLLNARHIEINAGFDTLRAHTFRPIVSSGFGQTKLKTISIKGGILRRIESYAFYALSNLDFIDLSYNKIKMIDRHSFAFRQISSRSLLVDLRGNHLNSESFESGSISRALRPMELVLASNESHCSSDLQYLDEDVFAPFFSCNNQNSLQLGPCPLVCDCNMKWLVDAPQHWRLQVRGGDDQRVAYVGCTQDKSLFELKSDDFGNCIPDCDLNILKMNIHAAVICKRNKNLNSIFK